MEMHNEQLEPQQPPQPQQPPRRPRSVVWPVILIVLGLGFLLNNLNILPFDIWSFLWRLWPVWLIAVGLDILIGRKVQWGSYVILGVVIAIVGGSMWFYSFFGPALTGQLISDTAIQAELKGATRADVEIRASVSEFRLGALSAGSSLLADGTINRIDGERIRQDHEGSGGSNRLTIRSEGFTSIPFWGRNQRGGRWDIKLNPDLPISLRLGAGVGESHFDLSQLNLSSLTIDSGVGQADITLPVRGRFDAQINTGVGETNIGIPEGMAARVRVRQGIGSISVGREFERQGDWYVTPGFDQAEHRVTLEVSGGIGAVRIERVK